MQAQHAVLLFAAALTFSRHVAAAGPVQAGPFIVFEQRFVHMLHEEDTRAHHTRLLDVMLRNDLLAHHDSLFSDPGELGHESARDAVAHALRMARHKSSDDARLASDLQRLLELLGPDKTSAESCYPATRRIIVAALVKLRLQGGAAWSAETEALVSEVARRLFHLHRLGAAYKGQIEYTHISKSGGTTVCAVAGLNDCERTSTRSNCLDRDFLDDRPRYVDHEEHSKIEPISVGQYTFAEYWKYRKGAAQSSCEFRDAAATVRGYRFLANEYTTIGGTTDEAGVVLCPQFLHFIVLREPHSRLVSHVHMLTSIYIKFFEDGARAFLEGRSAQGWFALMPAITDNYEARNLLGEKVFHLPLGSLGEQHLSRARMLLLRHDSLVTLESPDTNSLHLQYGLGWKHPMNESHDREAKALDDLTIELMPSETVMDELKAAQKIDLALYAFGSLLQHLDGFVFEVARAAGVMPLGSAPSATDEPDEPVPSLKCGHVGQSGLLKHEGLKPRDREENKAHYSKELERLSKLKKENLR